MAPPRTSRTAANTALVYVADRDSEGVIRQALNDLGVQDTQFVSGNVDMATAALARQSSPQLLIVDISGMDDPVLRIGELAEVCEPATGVIVIGDRNDIILYRNLKAAGVVEYFFKPLISELIARTCNGILTGSTADRTSRTAKLVYFLGVRGGVGATFLAVNTAWQLAVARNRWVMLLDLALQNGDAALQLDVKPSHALSEAFSHPERVDKLFLDRAVVHVEPRLDLLASLEPLGEVMSLPDDSVLTVLDGVLHRYRFVLVDMPIILAPGLTQALHLPSVCVLVSDGSLCAARDVARWREHIGPNSSERTTLHILNKHRGPGCLPDVEFNRAAGQEPDILIPYDREIANAANLGIKATQNSAVLKRGLAPLIRQLTGEQVSAERPFLSRLFG